VMSFGQQVERKNEAGETKAAEGLSAVLVVFEMCEMAMRARGQLGIEVLQAMVVMEAENPLPGFVFLKEMQVLLAGQQLEFRQTH
jgi:hypothetical protein